MVSAVMTIPSVSALVGAAAASAPPAAAAANVLSVSSSSSRNPSSAEMSTKSFSSPPRTFSLISSENTSA